MCVAHLVVVSSLASPAEMADVRRDPVVVTVNEVLPTVVNITTRTRVEHRGIFYDWWSKNWAPFIEELPPQMSAGSGVIIDEDGYIVTNVHVIEGADEIWVKMMDDSQPMKAIPIAGSMVSDIAVLKIQAPDKNRKFKAAKLAADDDLLLGETVIALGNPFGLGGSVSRGILSAKSRRSPSEKVIQLEVPDWIQTDAAINPGNSGGPLVNLHGEVIGINVAVYKNGQGIGFAIPVKQVSDALSKLITPEILEDLWFGARFKNINGRVEVVEVKPKSPAAEAGLRKGDILLKINNKPISNSIKAVKELIAAGKERPAELLINRGSRQTILKVELVEKRKIFNAALIRQKLGIIVKPAETEGLIIENVDRNSPASEAGIQPGMLIQAIDRFKVDNVIDAAEILFYKEKGQGVELTILTQRRRGFLIETYTGKIEVKVR